jgi:glycosyltransferase involved in cell wall biosynthesis
MTQRMRWPKGRPAAGTLGDPVRLKIAIVQQVVPHYRQRFYELLRHRLAEDGIELLLIHSNQIPQDERMDTVDLPWALRVPGRLFRLGSRQLVWQRCYRLLRDCDLVIVEQASRHLLNYVLLSEQILRRRKVALWGHGRNFDPLYSSRIGEAIKAWWSKRAHWWFAYNELSASLVRDLGVPNERITVVNNSIDTRELMSQVRALADDDLIRLRRELGLEGRHVGIYVGALVPHKHLDYLFAASERIREAVPDFELLVVGSGPGNNGARRFASDRPWVHVLGPKRGAEKAAVLAVSQLLLVPAAVGLVALDGLAAGIPIVVSSDLPHGPELSYVQNGVSALLVTDGGDPNRYADEVVKAFLDETGRQRLCDGALDLASHYTIEAMVDRFVSGIAQARRIGWRSRRMRYRNNPTS